MKVFVGDQIFTIEDGIIGVILTEQDKRNIAEMEPEATVYSMYDVEGHAPAVVDRVLQEVIEKARWLSG